MSSAKATNRSPRLAKRYALELRTASEVWRAGMTVGVGSSMPDSSRRYWLDGIVPPQRLQSLENELIWLWQCGHSIFC